MVTAMWVYGFGDAAWNTAVELGRLQCLGIDRVFLSLEAAQIANIPSPTPDAASVADFIARAHSVSIDVHAMVDQNNAWWQPASHPQATQQVSNVLSYNTNHPTAAFDGVHLDLEPWASPFMNDAELEMRLQGYETLLGLNRALVDAYNTSHPGGTITLSAAVASWMQGNAALPSGQAAVLKTHLHEIVLMAYNIMSVTDITPGEQQVVQTAPTIVGLLATNFPSWLAIQGTITQLSGYSWMVATGIYRGVSVFDYDVRPNKNTLPVSDLTITPWGAVTGNPPTWQSPDIYVVDCMTGTKLANAVNGQINCLVARVTNWGTLPATGVSVNFKYAPWFTGIPNAAFFDLGTVSSLAFLPGQSQEVRINWDLTDPNFTNGPYWQYGQSYYAHFCVRVSITVAGDLCADNNNAQTNFVDMVGGFDVKLHFLVGNSVDQPSEARLLLGALPAGFGAVLAADFVKGFGDVFLLKAGEIHTATVEFTGPQNIKEHRQTGDVIADVSMEIDGEVVGGISARLVAATKQRRRKR